MRILLIGNFSPPYEEESLHNITLCKVLKEASYSFQTINIGEVSSEKHPQLIDVVFINNYINFVLKFLRLAAKSDVVHFLTKAYTRPGLMKLITAVFFSKLLGKRVLVTLHPELFAIFGQLRSKMGGQQLLHYSFSMADRIICGDKHTLEVASSHYENNEKFTLLPTIILLHENKEDLFQGHFSVLKNYKKLIFFSGITSPSLIFNVVKEFINTYADNNVGILLSVNASNSDQTLHALEKLYEKRTDRIVIIPSDHIDMLSHAYSISCIVVRPLSCDCQPLFSDIALLMRWPRMSQTQLDFPKSLTFIKEGESSGHMAGLIWKSLSDLTENSMPTEDNVSKELKALYDK